MQELETKTGVGREAIRFYIKQGMLPEPEKPKRNVAIYSEEHVRRIRLIKALQDKRYLPLKQVKAVLDAPEAQALIASESMPGVEHFLPALLDTTPTEDKSLQELAQSSGLSVADIEQIAQTGVIRISEEGRLDFRDAAIVERWGAVNAVGYNKEQGYGPEFLAMYQGFLKQIADHEVDLFLGSVGKGLNGRDAAAIGAKGVNAANDLITLIHTKLILEALNQRAKSKTDTSSAG